MRTISLLGIDLSKNIFQLHAVDEKGNAILKKRLSRDKLIEYMAQLPICTSDGSLQQQPLLGKTVSKMGA